MNKKNNANQINQDDANLEEAEYESEEEQSKDEGIVIKRSYSVQFKLDAIEYQQKGHSIYKTAKVFKVDRKCIADWISKKDELIKIPLSKRKQTFSLKKQHSTSKNLWLFEHTYDFMVEQWSLNLCVTSHSIISFFLMADPKLKQKSMEYLSQLCFYFRKRYSISLRAPTMAFTSVNSSLIQTRVATFIQNYLSVQKQYGFDDNQIYNMDQTCVYYQTTPKRVYSNRGQKRVYIPLQNPSKKVTVILTVRKDGKKLPPFIIFKGSQSGTIRKEVTKLSSKMAHCITQENAWTDQDGIEEWKEFFFRNQNKKSKYLLMADSYKVHVSHLESILDLQNNQKVILIPKNCTSILQPLDVGIIHPFKQNLRKSFVHYQNQDVDRTLIIQQIIDAWSLIDHNTIINSFNKCLQTN